MDVFEETLDKGDTTVKACLRKAQTRIKACQESWRTEIKNGLEKMEANQEKTGRSRASEVPHEEAAVQTIGALKDRSGDQQPAVECRSPLKRRTRDDVVCGARKGLKFEKKQRTRTKCSNMRDRGARQQLLLWKVRTLNETNGQTLKPKVVKLALGFSLRIRKMTEHCRGAGPLPNERKNWRRPKCRYCRRTGHIRNLWPHNWK
jgi:hypothetical protein